MNGLRRIWPFMRPYRWELIGGILTTMLPVVMELVAPRLLQSIIDDGIVPGNFTAIWQGALLMLAAALLGALATVFQGVCRARLSQGLAFDLRNTLFRHVQSFSFPDLDRIQTGQIMTRLTSDVDMVRMFASAGLALILRALLMVLGSVVLMMRTDLRLSIIALVMLLLAGLVVRTILRLTAPLFQQVQQRLGALTTLVQESLAGVQVVKAFAREPHAVARYHERNVEYMEQNIKVGYLMIAVMPLLTILTNLGLVTVIWWGGADAIAGRLSVGQLVAFINYLMIGMAPLLLLSNMLTTVSRADVSARRVMEVLDTEPSIRVAAQPAQRHAGPLRGHVVFDNVSFAYGASDTMLAAPPITPTPGANGATAPAPSAVQTPVAASGNGSGEDGKAVLSQVSFEALAGQRIAILGATGAGKSTLVHLIPRFYDVSGGRVLVDGCDVRDWELQALRSQVGVVLQQNTLFSGTVRENIAYGRPDATLDEIREAAALAQAHDFIAALPDGYNSIVEARGANLSGGQKQRIAIARALLIQPAILILDDCTSAVDLDTEFRILEALETVMKRCTTFLVAQRINSVVDADQILILEAGRIVAHGPHDQLIAHSPLYREIYHSQVDVEEMRGLLANQNHTQ